MSVSDLLLEQILDEIRIEQKISDDALISLNFFFQGSLEQALDIIDNKTMTEIVSIPSGRKFYKFDGSKSKESSCFCLDTYYCSCSQYHTIVLKQKMMLKCSHLVAVLLLTALNDSRLKKEEIPDEEFGSLLCEM